MHKAIVMVCLFKNKNSIKNTGTKKKKSKRIDYLDMKYFNDIEVKYFEPKVDNYYSTLYNICKQ